MYHVFQAKSHKTDDKINDNEENFEPDYEPPEDIPEDNSDVRFLPKMAVRIKAIKGLPMGKGAMFGAVIKQTKGLVQVLVDEDELDVFSKDLEQLMPDPGDKAKMLQKTSSESVFEVIKYDSDDDEESVCVKNLDNGEESTVRLEHLCRVNM